MAQADICGLFNGTVSSADYIALYNRINNELIWKEAVMDQFKILFHLPGVTEKNRGKLRTAGLQAEI
jgi:hypothetical protein